MEVKLVADMTLREHFAGLAMQGIISNGPLSKGLADRAVQLELPDAGPVVAASALLFADALLKALTEGAGDV